MNKRRNEILQMVNHRKRIQVSELSEIIGVSGVTIRQDLNFLEKEGYLKRIHGAAVVNHVDDIDTRLEICFDVKQSLAIKAADLVTPNETVLIEGGSANALLARLLAERGDVTIITPSAYIAHLIRNTSANVILLGGVYQHHGESLVGPLTKLCIENINFSTAFLGVDGFHQDTGFTSRDMMRAEIASVILTKNRRNIVLTDSSKFGQIYPSTIGKTNNINILVTDSGISDGDLTFFKNNNVEVIF
ncbi:DeoR/GlpR family DNA-binding transcription regulator [Photobacterium damselae subsp. damselae]|uniref:Lactose phosphotransferase system repressor n=3 Tax=Gammaproteobacteria TaxID=1236 RepID=A0A2T3QLR8_PHODM|nr:DNA-binding transcriptional regulator YciT [Photobacterium damselae]KAB1181798.1 DeoR/GlpR transcriptional regulator [Photobacterium damselae subsp. damselae]MBF7100475.1 DeoR/GlpR transcriptional regulator [Photobacterium damselae]PSW85940.1 DeoR/GlpR transcriptional regulator [Photobacterium damselae]UKA27920.1 DeoR/GlpR family DNA-binding transcription regulator [Photobacterium damselae subsp. damselae]SPY44004.1 Lactose phosphotransferase system repressor [Photobacterium damselae]